MKLLKFYASWCQPCKMLSKVIEDAGTRVTVPVEDIDIDQNLEMAMKYNVRSVPTMVLLGEDGNELRRNVGLVLEADLLKFLKG